MKILVIHGPNLNLLGTRQKEIYGQLTLSEIDRRLQKLAKELKVELDIHQLNNEADMVTLIQQAPIAGCRGILINPAAYGHTSVALRDAFLAVALPFVEVHLSNIYNRELFRHTSLLSDIAQGVIVGLGASSYLLGLRGLVEAEQSTL